MGRQFLCQLKSGEGPNLIFVTGAALSAARMHIAALQGSPHDADSDVLVWDITALDARAITRAERDA